MNQRNNSPICERASDLIAFIYNEADEHETLDFQLHLRECVSCHEEVASFGVVRQSITAWRDEALSGFVSTPVPAPANKKSALAALRQFFDLSPLWLKGATALAAVALCVLGVFAVVKRDNNIASSTTVNPGAVYTAQDVDRIVKEALAKQELAKPVETHSPEVVAVKSPKPKKPRASGSRQFAKSRRPLSRAEREQLAADLRLLLTGDDETLNLLGDRINQ